MKPSDNMTGNRIHYQQSEHRILENPRQDRESVICFARRKLSKSDSKIKYSPVSGHSWTPHIACLEAINEKTFTRLRTAVKDYCKAWTELRRRHEYPLLDLIAEGAGRFVKIESAGKGRYACVNLHTDHPTIAFKTSLNRSELENNRDSMSPEEAFDSLVAEKYYYSAIGPHPNIAKHLGFAEVFLNPFEDSQSILCMQLYDMSLNGFLKGERLLQNPNIPYEYVVRKSLRDAANGITYMHKKNIIHRDMKTGNILLQYFSNATCVKAVIADLGVALHMDRQDELQPIATREAPEILKYYIDGIHRNHTKWTDTWSFGVMLMDILFGYSRDTPYFAHLDEKKGKKVLCSYDDHTLRCTDDDHRHWRNHLKGCTTDSGPSDLTLEKAVSASFISVSDFDFFMTHAIHPSQIKLNQFTFSMQLLICSVAFMKGIPTKRMPLSHFKYLQDEWLKRNRHMTII